MGISLPQQGDVSLPEVPRQLEKSNKDLYEYLKRQQRVLQVAVQGMFNNDFTVATSINSGVSGVFAISSGGHITVVNGIVTSITS